MKLRISELRQTVKNVLLESHISNVIALLKQHETADTDDFVNFIKTSDFTVQELGMSDVEFVYPASSKYRLEDEVIYLDVRKSPKKFVFNVERISLHSHGDEIEITDKKWLTAAQYALNWRANNTKDIQAAFKSERAGSTKKSGELFDM